MRILRFYVLLIICQVGFTIGKHFVDYVNFFLIFYLSFLASFFQTIHHLIHGIMTGHITKNLSSLISTFASLEVWIYALAAMIQWNIKWVISLLIHGQGRTITTQGSYYSSWKRWELVVINLKYHHSLLLCSQTCICMPQQQRYS